MHHRKSIGEASVKIVINKEALNDTQRKTLNLLAENTQLSAAKIAEHIGISRRNVESNMKKLKDQGILIRHGSPKNGYWEIIS
ncbi:MAG: winged helix-turn-helix domain-containing protein [Lachnospiraceae bacterium]|nr:winged helix-turn-helix domain-containing protein [Lachnospiraceae bacterium]